MGIGVGFYIRNLVARAVEERVSQAREDRKVLRIPDSAARIGTDYPAAFSQSDLRNRLFAEATLADVEVSLARTAEPGEPQRRPF